MRIILIVLALLSALLAPAAAQERPNTILVLDASGSMWGQIGGINKIVIARQVVARILAGFPADRNLGLIAYGHRRRGDCGDIQTLLAPAPGAAAEIAGLVEGLNPRGMAPMTDAVIAAAEALRHTEAAATVILVSDGIETCHPDPCAAARALAETGVDFTAHVVGFDVAGEAQALMQMQCIAEETGGLFLTADNAEELTAALETVVAAIETPAPEPETASLTLRAVLGTESGPEITDPVVWTLGGPAAGLEAEGNPVTLDLPLGAYEITGYHVVFEQTVAIQATLAAGARTLTLVFQPPAPAAVLTAPETAAAGSVIEVGWSGPDERGDNIQIAQPGGRMLAFTYTARGNPVRLQMPAEPGTYELRYRLRDSQTIATRPITVVPVAIGLIAPDRVPAGSVIEVGWSGPDARGDNIQIASVGGGLADYAYTSRGNPVRLVMPFAPGTYELRYRFQDRETIFTLPIEVTPAAVALAAPDRALAGSRIEVGWTGPDAPGDNIQVGEPGGRLTDFTYTARGNPVALTLPSQPGTYELRYRFRDRETIATRTIEVLAEMPPEAPAGTK